MEGLPSPPRLLWGFVFLLMSKWKDAAIERGHPKPGSGHGTSLNWNLGKD